MRIHPSAFKHGITEDAIKHAFANPVKIASLDQDHEPAKVLVIGSDAAGNLLELVVYTNEGRGGDDDTIVHAMKLRRTFYPLLGGEENE